MGLGMLFAGALTGGAKAVGELTDDAIKQRERAEVRQQSIMDRRNELLFEMKAKADWAKREEEATADAYTRVAERGAQIGNERGARELEAARSMVPREGEFANDRITPEMLANMPPAARAIYEKEMGLTDDSTLQGLRDQVQASGEVATPAAVRKGILDSYKEEFKADKDEKDRKFKAEQEDRKDARVEANNDAREERERIRAEAAMERATRKGAAGSIDQTEKLSVLKDVLAKAEASKPNPKDYRNNKLYEAAVEKWSASESGQMAQTAAKRINAILAEASARPEQGAPTVSALASATQTPEQRASGDVAALQREIAAIERGKDKPDVKEERLRILRSELAKAQSLPPQKSTVKDNPTTASAKPVEVKTKAAYDALPKGAKYVAPDGTVRTKG